MITLDVADGIHLVSHAHVNCYVVEADEGVTLVDAGLPGMWRWSERCSPGVGGGRTRYAPWS